MKIIYLHQYFVTPDQGGGTRSYEFARRLVAAGHSVEIVTSDRSVDRPTWERSSLDGFVVHRVGVEYSNNMSFDRRILAFAKFAQRCASKAVELKGDVVFATSTPLTIALPGVYASRRRRVPFVFEVRDLWPEIPIAMGALPNPLMRIAARGLEQLAYRSAKHVVTLSPGMQAGVVRAGIPIERTSVIPNSCDFDIFDLPPARGEEFRRNHEWLGDRPLIVYAGTLGLANGVKWLVRVAKEALTIDPEVRFLVIGEGKEKEEIRSLAKELDVLGVNFFQEPGMKKEEVAQVLSAATIATSLFIPCAALEHNSANKFFDALAAGRPVATNGAGWISELLVERNCGLRLDLDPGRAAAQLIERTQDTEWLRQAGSASQALGRERFDRDNLAAQLEQILRDVVRG